MNFYIRVAPSRIKIHSFQVNISKLMDLLMNFLYRLPCMKWAIYTCEMLTCGCMCVCNPSFAWELFYLDAWKESQKSCEYFVMTNGVAWGPKNITNRLTITMTITYDDVHRFLVNWYTVPGIEKCRIMLKIWRMSVSRLLSASWN